MGLEEGERVSLIFDYDLNPLNFSSNNQFYYKISFLTIFTIWACMANTSSFR